MTDSMTPRDGQEQTSLPGLQIIGDAMGAGVCADGFCTLPAEPIGPVAEKA